jgi:hypothetical protein
LCHWWSQGIFEGIAEAHKVMESGLAGGKMTVSIG